jgi:hypothetical protein
VEADWRTPGEIRNAAWVESVGGVATPLLGGFSLASVIVVSEDAASFRWPGPVILALTVAAAVLIAAVQFAQVARREFATRSDLPLSGRVYHQDTDPVPDFTPEGYEQRADALVAAERAYGSARHAYHCGVFALLIGLALALAPKPGTGLTESVFRWFSVGLALTAFLGQVVFMTKPTKDPRVGQIKAARQAKEAKEA